MQGKSSMQKFKASHSKKQSLTTKGTKFRKNTAAEFLHHNSSGQHHFMNNFVNENS